MRIRETAGVKRVIPSGIRTFYDKAMKLASKGIDVIDFTLGRPDFKTPPNICDAAKKALDLGQVHYTPNPGLIELREAISRKALRDSGQHYHPETEVIVTLGSCEAIAVALATFVSTDDEVIIPSPHWPNYSNLTLMNLGNPVFVPLTPENGFRLKATDLKRSITTRTKVLFLNNPHNPTGAVMGEEDLKIIAEIASSHDILVIADEVYEKIIFEGAKFIPFASLDEMRERTIWVNSCSKTYSMTGWRIGWICAPTALASSMQKVHQQFVTCATSFAQAGALEALEGPQEIMINMINEFDQRRTVLLSESSQIPLIEIIPPQGTFYCFIDIRRLNLGSSEQVALTLLEEAYVAVVPGSAFGESGEGYIRMSFCCSSEKIREGLRRLKDWIEKKRSHEE